MKLVLLCTLVLLVSCGNKKKTITREILADTSALQEEILRLESEVQLRDDTIVQLNKELIELNEKSECQEKQEEEAPVEEGKDSTEDEDNGAGNDDKVKEKK